jgi:hypothetical protein
MNEENLSGDNSIAPDAPKTHPKSAIAHYPLFLV